MSAIQRFDHVGITVADLDLVTAFFVALGFEVEFLDAAVGIPDARTEMVMLRPPEEGTRLELTRFIRPEPEPGSPDAMATRLGLSNVSFEATGLPATLDHLTANGYSLIGGVGEYQNVWRMASVRGPEGRIVNLAERV